MKRQVGYVFLAAGSLALAGCAADERSPHAREAPILSVDAVTIQPEALQGRLIRIEGYLLSRGDYVELNQPASRFCSSRDPNERFIVIRGLRRSELERLGIRPFGLGPRIIVEGRFTNDPRPLPRSANGVSTEGYSAPVGPLSHSRIIQVSDTWCEARPGN